MIHYLLFMMNLTSLLVGLIKTLSILSLLFFQSPDLYKIYTDELRDARIPYKDSPELIWLLLEFSYTSPSLFEKCKVRILYLS